jgi:cholesterol transport system auxiliary component
MKRQVLCFILLPLLIQGCFMQPVSLPEVHQYQLTANSSTSKTCSRTSQTLFVSLPLAIPPYSSTKMVYSQKPNEICYFAENRWVTPLPQMMLPLILQSIRKTHYFQTVVGFPMVANTNYQLDSSLITFKQEFCGQKSRVHILLDVTLICLNTQKVVASCRIDVLVPTLCPTPASGINAYQIALNSALRQLNSFIIDSL